MASVKNSLWSAGWETSKSQICLHLSMSNLSEYLKSQQRKQQPRTVYWIFITLWSVFSLCISRRKGNHLILLKLKLKLKLIHNFEETPKNAFGTQISFWVFKNHSFFIGSMKCKDFVEAFYAFYKSLSSVDWDKLISKRKNHDSIGI
jgi:hypothetical protein